jgi:hypothetical protein
MSGSGQSPSFFSRVTRDRTDRNVRDVTSLQVPLSDSAPTVAHGGQLYFNTSSETLFVSVGNAWVELAFST